MTKVSEIALATCHSMFKASLILIDPKRHPFSWEVEIIICFRFPKKLLIM